MCVTRDRAEDLIGRGFGFADAAHVAFAEAMRAGFVSSDDRLLRQRSHVRSGIWTGTPVAFCEKEDLK